MQRNEAAQSYSTSGADPAPWIIYTMKRKPSMPSFSQSKALRITFRRASRTNLSQPNLRYWQNSLSRDSLSVKRADQKHVRSYSKPNEKPPTFHINLSPLPSFTYKRRYIAKTNATQCWAKKPQITVATPINLTLHLNRENLSNTSGDRAAPFICRSCGSGRRKLRVKKKPDKIAEMMLINRLFNSRPKGKQKNLLLNAEIKEPVQPYKGILRNLVSKFVAIL